MYKIGEYLIYNKDVCKVQDIKEKYVNDQDYYVLKSLLDTSLSIQIPVLSTKIRSLISLSDLESIIQSIPSIEVIEANERMIENTYKSLMKSGTHKDLIKIIKTTYLRNKTRFNSNKKISEVDDSYFRKAEKFLYNEFSIVLNKTFDETKEYVISRVTGEMNV